MSEQLPFIVKLTYFYCVSFLFRNCGDIPLVAYSYSVVYYSFVALKDPTSALNLMTRKSDIESMGNAIRFVSQNFHKDTDIYTLD